MTLADYLNLRYKIVLIPQDDGTWGAIIPDLFGVMGAGDTQEEALEVLEEARKVWIEYRFKSGHDIPLPTK